MKENDTSDKSVEQAIDDIFGTDFIEIDINDKGEKENVTYEDSISFVPLENQVSKDALEVKEPLEEVLIKKEETTPSVDIKKESSDKSFNNGNDNKNKEKNLFKEERFCYYSYRLYFTLFGGSNSYL